MAYTIRFTTGMAGLLFTLTSAPLSAVYHEVGSLRVPTAARQMIYAPATNTLVLKNTSSAVFAMDLGGAQAVTSRLATTKFTDMSLSPSGRYVFVADYGGENIGYGTPASQSYVHRLDLVTRTWETRFAHIAGNVQAVSDTQLILMSLDQWVSFTNNAWGVGLALTILNTPTYGPGYYAGVYYGNFRYNAGSGRLVHGNAGLSSQELAAFRLVANDFVRQESSGTYGSAQGYGGTLVRSTDGSSIYYGRLQIDGLDVTQNRRVFPEPIYAANSQVAFGNRAYYDVQTGAMLGLLPFTTTVYALNPAGDDFWAYDDATFSAHHFAPGPATSLSFYAITPCRLADTRIALGPDAAAPPLTAHESRQVQLSGRCGISGSAVALAVNLTTTGATAPGSLSLFRADLGTVPTSSSITFAGGGPARANNGILDLSREGFQSFIVTNTSAGTVDFILDVVGYFQ